MLCICHHFYLFLNWLHAHHCHQCHVVDNDEHCETNHVKSIVTFSSWSNSKNLKKYLFWDFTRWDLINRGTHSADAGSKHSACSWHELLPPQVGLHHWRHHCQHHHHWHHRHHQLLSNLYQCSRWRTEEVSGSPPSQRFGHAQVIYDIYAWYMWCMSYVCHMSYVIYHMSYAQVKQTIFIIHFNMYHICNVRHVIHMIYVCCAIHTNLIQATIDDCIYVFGGRAGTQVYTNIIGLICQPGLSDLWNIIKLEIQSRL